jgi:hypothetical protein
LALGSIASARNIARKTAFEFLMAFLLIAELCLSGSGDESPGFQKIFIQNSLLDKNLRMVFLTPRSRQWNWRRVE